PQIYDGSPKKLEEFLSDLRLCFLADPKHFNTPLSKILFAFSFMKGGSAHPWAVNENRDESAISQKYPTWQSFEAALRARFQMGNRKTEAQDALEYLHQRGRPAEEYFDDFEAQAPYSGFNDDALINLLKRRLNEALVDKMFEQTEMPTTYLGWKELAIVKDRLRRE
ncbi:hypothetical protein M413DRAFT_36678, partial [Hebeloma cylindrosporum]